MEIARIDTPEAESKRIQSVRPRKRGSLASKEERLAWILIAPVILALLALGV